ncbi:GAF domain-containing protein [Glaciecola sp. 1036]|uniref:GAF domain-containing protein n=1 Tax=Alteromonadaceae TaxID=72275 RepID=UPI003CFD0853
MLDLSSSDMSLYQQIEAITQDEPDIIANLANISAILFNQMEQINWAGFYLMKDGMLVLGPFQGQPACIRIPLGKGVCGTAAALNQTMLVEDVHQFEGHIACDAASNSEIVIPICKDSEVYAVLDIDSPMVGRFSEDDKVVLEKVARLIESVIAKGQ